MDLETLEEKKVTVTAVDDTVSLLSDVEEMVELETDTESAFSTLMGLTPMVEEYETILSNADRESITESQLTALRIGVVSGLQNANADARTVMGIDLESDIVVPSSALALDLEGIKDFAKKMWEKFKRALIKANAFFKKLFVKFLNLVTFRKGTIEKLMEDMEASSSVQTEIKSKKLANSFAFHDFIGKKDVSSEVDISDYKEIYNATAIIDSTKALTAGVKDLGERAKEVKKSAESDLKGNFPSIGMSKFAELKNALRGLGVFKVNEKTVIAKEKVDIFIPAGAWGLKLPGISIDTKGKAKKFTLTPTGKPSSIKGVSQSNLVALLKSAEKANDDFKSTVDDIFAIVGDVMSISDDMDDVMSGVKDFGQNDADKKATFNTAKKGIQNTISILPWFAFKSSMALYKEIGGVIALSKEALKEGKDK